MATDEQIADFQLQIDKVIQAAVVAGMRAALDQARAPYEGMDADALAVLNTIVYHRLHIRLAERVGAVEVLMMHKLNITEEELRVQRDQAVVDGAAQVRNGLDAQIH